MDSIQTFLNKLVHLYGDQAFLDEDRFLQLSEAHFSQSPGKRKVLALLIQKGVPKYLLSWKGIDEGPTKASAEQVRDSLVIKLADANLASKEALYWAVSALLSVLIGREDLYPITSRATEASRESVIESKPTAPDNYREKAKALSASSSGGREQLDQSWQSKSESKDQSRRSGKELPNYSDVGRKNGKRTGDRTHSEPISDDGEMRVDVGLSSIGRHKRKLAYVLAAFAIVVGVIWLLPLASKLLGNSEPKCDDTDVIALVGQLASDQLGQAALGWNRDIEQEIRDPETPNSEKEQYKKLASSAADYTKQVKFELQMIAVENYNKDNGRYTCSASITSSLPQELISSVVRNDLLPKQLRIGNLFIEKEAYARLQNVSDSIRYTVQRSADRKQILVEVNGMSKIPQSYPYALGGYIVSESAKIYEPRRRTKEQERKAELSRQEQEQRVRESERRAENQRHGKK